jgi:hypothetical protein
MLIENAICISINSEILITEMAASNEAKKVIPLKFLQKIIFFPIN